MAQWPRTTLAKAAAEHAGGDIGSPLGLDLVASLDAAFDHADGGEFREAGGARIGTIRSDPVDHIGDRNAIAFRSGSTVSLVLSSLVGRWRRPCRGACTPSGDRTTALVP